MQPQFQRELNLLPMFFMIKISMNKVKRFAQIFIQSATLKKSFYNHLIQSHWSLTFKYLLTLAMAFQIFGGLINLWNFRPNKFQVLKNQVISSLSAFPEELVIKLNQGFLSTNYYKPYFFRLNQSRFQPLLVIDETADAGKILEYQSVILLTATNIVVSNKWQPQKPFILPLPNSPLQIDRKIIINNIPIINRTLISVYQLALIYFIVFLPAWLLFQQFLLISVLIAVYIFICNLKHKHRWQRNSLYHIAYHASTTPIVLTFILMTVFRFNFIYLFISQTLLTLIFFYLMLRIKKIK